MNLMPSFSVFLKKSQRTILVDNRISLLQALEIHGISPEYQCRNGFCGACRTKIYQGKVSYPTPPLAYFHHNEILLCCCKVESDLVLDK